MKVIKPVIITDDNLISSSVVENDYAEWSAATTYAVDDHCIMASTHRIYKSLQASNLNHQPDQNLGGLTPYWLDVGPTNRWGMLDEQVGTLTTAEDSISITVGLGRVDTVGLLQLTAQQVDIAIVSGGETVYTESSNLVYGQTITDWWKYFMDPVKTLTDLIFSNLPPYADCEITITLTGTGTVACGMVVAGLSSFLGYTEYGCTLGMVDYSVKTADEFGNQTLTVRKYTKTLDATLNLNNADIDRLHLVLADVRATPCLWVGVDQFYTQLALFGFFKDFSIQITYPTVSTCNLQIEGMI